VVIQKKKPAPATSKSPLAAAVELVQRKAQVVPTKRRRILKKKSKRREERLKLILYRPGAQTNHKTLPGINPGRVFTF
jgi:hypothetical protein